MVTGKICSNGYKISKISYAIFRQFVCVCSAVKYSGRVCFILQTVCYYYTGMISFELRNN